MAPSRPNRFLVPVLLVIIGVVVVILMNKGGSEGTGDGTGPDDGSSAGKSGAGAVAGKAPSRPPGSQRSDAPLPREFKPPVFPEELAGASAAGIKEADDYVKGYRELKSPEAKSDLLSEARSLDLEDYSVINNLLVEEAAHEDEVVREAARTALREYGGVRAAETLARYLEFRDKVPDRKELEEIVEFMGLPEADLTRPRSK